MGMMQIIICAVSSGTLPWSECQELAILCQKYSSPLRDSTCHILSHLVIAVCDYVRGGDMRELINSGSTDEVQAVYEAIEPQTRLGGADDVRQKNGPWK